MATAALTFGNQQESGDAELAGASPLAVNVLMDGKGAVRRRPGISAWSGFPSAIPEASAVTGICQFQGDAYYVNAARKIHRITVATAADLALSTADLLTCVAGTGAPVFAETKYRLVVAGGDVPQKVDAASLVAARLGGSPPASTQMVMLNQRLISDDLTSSQNLGQFRMSGLGNGATGEEFWDALDFIEADARPDAIVAIRENTNELYIFGETNLQIYSPDASTIFAPSRTTNLGCVASASVVRKDEQFAWLATGNRFMLGDGRSNQDISNGLSRTFDLMPTVDDCVGFRWMNDQFDCLAWRFPTDGRTFVYQDGSGWGQWNGWDATNGNYGPLGITSHYFWEQRNLHLVGLSTGQVARLDADAATDLGAPIKAEIRTGFNNHGTDAYKSCEAVRLTFKRGQSATGGTVLLSWRDGMGAFCSPLRIPVGVTGDDVVTIEKRSLGTYRRRQWRLEMSDAVEFVLASVEEVFTVEDQD